MIYILRHKDIPVCVFDLDKEVVSASINSNTADHLPLPLKRILHYPEEFVSENENGRIRLTESGCDLVDYWLNDRTIPAKRRNLDKYTRGKNTLTWMLENHACSLDDCYWIHSIDENLNWDQVKLYGYDQVDILTQESLAGKQFNTSCDRSGPIPVRVRIRIRLIRF